MLNYYLHGVEEDPLEHEPLFQNPRQKERSDLGKEGGVFSRTLEGVGQPKFSRFEESLVKDGSQEEGGIVLELILQTSSHGLGNLDFMEVKRSSLVLKFCARVWGRKE